MDSGNSDSFQSSNGGDDQYNSRGGGGDAISAFINPPATQGGGLYNPPPHQPMFNPIIPNYQTLQNNMLLINNNNNNLDMVLSKTLIRSDPNQLFTIQNSNHQPSSSTQEIMNTNSRTSSLPLSEHHETHGLHSVQNPNPKKRSRASRRAPTTVLTTDTTNFRAMVQEFTGIPAPPFTSSSSSYSSLFPRNIKLDNIFGKPNYYSMRSNNPLDYSISPSSQPPPLISSMFGASMVDSLCTNVENGYQSLQRSNLFAMQNPILASLLQPNPDKPILSNNPSIFKSKTHHESSNGVLHEFGSLGQDLVDENGSLPRLVSADPARWGGGAGGVNGGGGDQVRSFGNNNGEFDDFSRNVANRKRLKRMMENGALS